MLKKLVMVVAVLSVWASMSSAALLTSDNFNDGIWDYSQWSKYTNDAGKVDESDGSAWFAKYYGAPATERGMLSSADLNVADDFSVAIDYDLSWDCPWHDSWRLTWDSMYLHILDNGHDAKIERYIRNGGDATYAFIYDGTLIGSMATASFTPETKESMKIERIGDNLVASYKIGSDWILLGSRDVSADFNSTENSAQVKVRLWANEDRDGKMRVDNIVVSQIPEPSVIVLLITGLIGVIRRKW